MRVGPQDDKPLAVPLSGRRNAPVSIARKRSGDCALLKRMIASVVRSIHLQLFARWDLNVAQVELRSGAVTNMVFEESAFE
ncbi:hypothetical protein CO668_22245 [Rhizobium anhuiense]|nr:hypothetical protein CO668_22245 [Rhizobium anhuiense]